MKRPIGILGGIFDPVHNGHLAAAELAAEYFNCEKILFIPAGTPPHKRSTVTASAQHRLSMLRGALLGNERAEIWTNEIERTGVSYTIDTLDELAAQYPGAPLYFIIGADNLHEIHSWHRYTEILSRVTLCVTERPGFSMEVPQTLCRATIKTFPSPHWGLSSTGIRTLFAQGYSCRYLLPQNVQEYIMSNGLYRLADADTLSGAACAHPKYSG